MNQTRLYDVDRMRVRVDDEERLAALRAYRILDTAPEAGYEQAVDLMHRVCGCAWAAVTFVDRERQWFKARRGFPFNETARSVSFCSVGIQQMKPLIVENATLDPRFKNNPLVEDMGVRFFAGYPMFSDEGHGLGSVCVLDMKPRTLMLYQLNTLERARDWVKADLSLRRGMLEWKDGAGRRGAAEQDAMEQRLALRKSLAEKAWGALMELNKGSALNGARA